MSQYKKFTLTWSAKENRPKLELWILLDAAVKLFWA
jgi:hypothetical protein